MMGSNQSTFIAGSLAAAFLLFITVRGELPTYLGFLLGSSTGASAAPAQTSASTSSQTGSDYGKLVSEIAPIALAAL